MLVGIDIGGTYAKIAQLRPDGKPIPIRDLSFSEYTYTPSVIYLNQDGAMVGRQAKVLFEEDPKTSLIKVPVQQLGIEKILLKISETEQWSAEAIYALMLKKLLFDIEGEAVPSIKGVVINIPPNFSDKQKQSVSYAVAMLDVQLLALVPSPIAIALNSLIDKSRTNKILIVDIGGQSLHISLVESGTPTLQIVAHKTLSGFDESFFNQPLIDEILQQFRERNEKFEDNVFNQVQVKKAAEAIKKELVANSNSHFVKKVVVGDYMENIFISKSAYYAAIEDGCRQIVTACQELIVESQNEISDINYCILTGGESHIPLLQDLLLAAIPLPITHLLHQNPIHNAAFGAALFTDYLDQIPSEERLPADFYGKASKSIGIRIVDEEKDRVYIDILVDENQSLPREDAKIYYASSNAKTVSFELGYYIGKDSNTFTLLDTLSIPIERNDIKKYQLELNYHYTTEGMLKIYIVDLQSNKHRKQEYPLFDDHTLLMLQQKQLVKSTRVNDLG